jgi:hypothetical protein
MRKLASHLKRNTFFAGVAVAILVVSTLAGAAQKKGAAGASVFTPDKGKLSILLDGKTVGHEEFEIAPSGGGWMAKGTSEIKPPEGEPMARR